MTPSQRSESMNAFFDGYVNSKTALHEFLDACDRALDELRDSSGCWYDHLSKDGVVEEYLVGPRNDVKSRWFRVFYDDSDGVTVKCDCAKFEREGILCKHILRIMDTKQLKKVPDHYTLRRWSIQAMYQKPKRKHKEEGDVEEDEEEEEEEEA
ncbi:protein FAR-RED ELONGATED HYPOCOTYL 3-like [Tasmannia lanceolata]|uniref:protein FAR-RED ELONGATED HYPOCOTYL 3-like n=1 Tax=Tasmannia lanceolata TaxID=3420 RepID=UPI00406319EC